jgi:multiple sugar transport system permease protein
VRRLAAGVAGRTLLYAAATVLGALFALPLLWLLVAPFDAAGSLTVHVPGRPTLQNFADVLHNDFAMTAIGNSVILAAGTMLLVTLTATMAAYALSRARVPYSGLLTYALILFSSVVSGTAAIVPIFLLADALHLVDTYPGVILAFAGGFLPTGIFILRDFVDGLPRSYEEAAVVSGASPVQVFRDVVLPLLRPGLMVVAIWTFVNVWGAFLIPFVLLRSPGRTPASIAIYSFYTESGLPVLTLTAAYSLLYAIPVVLLYLFVSWRYGFRFFGGIKG